MKILTEPFTILVPQNPSIGEFHVVSKPSLRLYTNCNCNCEMSGRVRHEHLLNKLALSDHITLVFFSAELKSWLSQMLI